MVSSIKEINTFTEVKNNITRFWDKKKMRKKINKLYRKGVCLPQKLLVFQKEALVVFLFTSKLGILKSQLSDRTISNQDLHQEAKQSIYFLCYCVNMT